MRIVMGKNEHTINMANKLINTLTSHCLRVGAAKVSAVLTSEVNAAWLIEDGIIIHLTIVWLHEVHRIHIRLGIGDAGGASRVIIGL